VINASTENLFWRDTQAGTTYAVTTAGVRSSAMTLGGRFVAFISPVGYGALYVWDSQVQSYAYSNAAGAFSNVAISATGTRLAYSDFSSQLYAADLIANTNWLINSQVPFGSHATLRFSGDGRFLSYVGLVSKTNQVYLYDFQTGTNILISRSFNSTNAANGSSDSPDISPDGRFVAYRSSATNIVPGDSNGAPDVFLYDRVTGATTLLSVSRFANQTADNRSLRPVFCGDDQTLFFESWASDLTTNDFNHNSDVFAYSLYSSNTIPPFSAGIVSPAAPGLPPTITWPVVQGKFYQAQFKDRLTDPFWQSLNGNLILMGATGYLYDFAPNPNQRFYRILLSN
jgi:hypothetical protein